MRADEKHYTIGPYRAGDVQPGEPYEISDGYKIECMGTGQRGSRSNGSGFMVLDSDPSAPPAGVDAGVSPVPTMLRAPDVSVGGLEDAPGKAVRTVVPGGTLDAPGILKNTVPIEALYDRDAAHRQTLRNLLQREGYESLEAVKAEGHGEGVDAGRLTEARSLLRRVLARRKLDLAPEQEARIAASGDLAALERWLDQAIDATSAAEALH